MTTTSLMNENHHTICDCMIIITKHIRKCKKQKRNELCHVPFIGSSFVRISIPILFKIIVKITLPDALLTVIEFGTVRVQSYMINTLKNKTESDVEFI